MMYMSLCLAELLVVKILWQQQLTAQCYLTTTSRSVSTHGVTGIPNGRIALVAWVTEPAANPARYHRSPISVPVSREKEDLMHLMLTFILYQPERNSVYAISAWLLPRIMKTHSTCGIVSSSPPTAYIRRVVLLMTDTTVHQHAGRVEPRDFTISSRSQLHRILGSITTSTVRSRI